MDFQCFAFDGFIFHFLQNHRTFAVQDIDICHRILNFDDADVFLFCSAQLSRMVMEADPMNIAHCPYGIFVTDKDGAVEIGYRNLPEGPMQEVQSLLDSIVKDALQ